MTSSLRISLLFALFQLVSSSGHFDITLRSPWKHEAAVGVYQASTAPLGAVKSVSLKPNEESTLKFAVDFNQTVKIVITVGGSANFGLEHSRFETIVIPVKGSSVTPETVPVPLDGLRITFACDQNFHGDQCQRLCKNDVAEKFGKRCNSAGFTACPHGFMGQECTERVLISECPCQNMGKCSNSFVSATEEVAYCECAQGFYGQYCEARREEQTIQIRTFYSPELRFVPQIVEKHYRELAMKNGLEKKRVVIGLDKRTSRKRL